MVEIKEFFVPDHCIQGEDISSHITWKKDKFKNLKIKLPQEWTFTEVFNVEEQDIDLNKNELFIKKTEVPGFFAFSFKTSKYEIPNKTKKIIGIFNEEKDKEISKKIFLFRPDIKISKTEKDLILNVSDKGNYGSNGYYKLENNGRGIGYINIVTDKNSDIKLKQISENQEFMHNIINDIEKKFPKLKDQFPKNSDLIDRFIADIKKTESLNKKRIKEIKKLNDDFNEAFENDWDFASSFIDLLVSIYLANINIITPMNSFLNYLKSMRKNNIYIINSLSVLDIKKNGTFSGKIEISDMAFNEYNTYPIKFKVKAKTKAKVPIYYLIKWRKGD
jgi:hypothetical protein